MESVSIDSQLSKSFSEDPQKSKTIPVTYFRLNDKYSPLPTVGFIMHVINDSSCLYDELLLGVMNVRMFTFSVFEVISGPRWGIMPLFHMVLVSLLVFGPWKRGKIILQ